MTEDHERTLRSLSAMLGWSPGIIPPRESLERDIASLKASHAQLADSARQLAQVVARADQAEQERDEALKSAKSAWSAATDDTIVGFHRDMAARFAEDRDVQKHLARRLTGALEHERAQSAALREALEQWIVVSLDRSFPWWAAELRGLLTAPQEPVKETT